MVESDAPTYPRHSQAKIPAEVKHKDRQLVKAPGDWLEGGTERA